MPRLKRLEKNEGDAKSQEMMGTLEGNGKLFNIFRGLANSPAALDSYLKLSGALNNAKLDAKAREAIALVVGQQNRCDYCLAAHTAIGKGAGMNDAAIKDARLGRSQDRKTQAAVTLARAMVEKKGNVTEQDVKAARDAGLGDAELAEIPAVVALNLMTNYFNLMNQTDVDFPKVAVDVA